MMALRARFWGRVERTFSSLRVRNFRLYFFGQFVSVSGTFMQTVAQAWLVLKLTDSGTALGLVAGLQYLPMLFFSPIGGVIADRFSKRRLLYFTQSVSGALAIALGVLVAGGWVRLWMVYVLAFSLGLVNAVDNPVRQTFVPEIVRREGLRNAVTLVASATNLARVVGPAVGGIVIAKAGLAPCFVLNGLSYAAVLIGLFLMRGDELYTPHPVPHARGRIREGLEYAASHPVIRSSLLLMAVIGTFTYEFQVSLPMLARFTFNGGAESYAALTAAMGVGAVFGGLFVAGHTKTTHSLLVRVAFLFGLSVLFASVMPDLVFAVFCMLFVGVFSVYFISLGSTILQLESAPQMRGRVMSLWTVAFFGSTAVGGPVVGWVSEVLSPRWGLTVGGLAAVFAAAWGRREYARLSGRLGRVDAAGSS